MIFTVSKKKERKKERKNEKVKEKKKKLMECGRVVGIPGGCWFAAGCCP